MTDEEIRNEMKKRLLITDDFHNDMIDAFIVDVKYYLKSAGVKETTLDTEAALRCIYRGIYDLYSGQSNFSRIFTDQVIHLASEKQEA